MDNRTNNMEGFRQTVSGDEKQSTHQLEIRPGGGETQEESIRTSPESVVENGAALARERKIKLTLPGGSNCDVNGPVHPNDTQSSR
ncbi:hypothetical protein TNCV_2661861 [Trichonephila clavipes]|nr:hypothetical protein TNCV_2661861 [Trichonephila clavipes]